MNYQDLYYFIKVTEKGSIVAASKYLNIPTSTLSRRLQAFEQDLGYKLIHRSAKKFGLTEAGRLFFNSLSGTIKELENKYEDVNSELSSLSGDIKITAPVSLGHHYIKEWVFEFMELNPMISVEMFLSNDNVDLVKNSIDIAFRIGKLTLNDWVSRALFDTPLIVCASPSLLDKYQKLTVPDDLDKMPLIVLKRTKFWRFIDVVGDVHTYTPKPHLRTDEINFAMDAAKRGLGVSCIPQYIAQDALDNGDLLPVLDAWKMENRSVHILYPHRESLPVKTRAFIDFIMHKSKQMN